MICDRVAILHRGQMVREGTVGELTKQEGRFVIGLAPDQAFPTEEIGRLGYTFNKVGERYEVAIGADPSAIDQVIACLSEKGLKLRHLVEKRRTLEDLFVSLVEPATGDAPSREVRR